MTDFPPSWIAQIIADLRRFSSELIEPGLAPTIFGVKSEKHNSPLRSALTAAEYFCRCLPSLLSELDKLDTLSNSHMTTSFTPRSARLSAHPSDYLYHEGKILPHRWLVPNLDQEPLLEPLRWLFSISLTLKKDLSTRIRRLEKQVDAARLARHGNSFYAIQEAGALDKLMNEALHILRKIELSSTQISRFAGQRITPRPHPPSPFPRSALWQIFRQEISYQFDPKRKFGAWVSELLRDPVPIADIPFLYQRWCGLQIILASQRLGWHAPSDPTAALYLGGRIEFLNQASKITLWIDPRITDEKSEIMGWQCEDKSTELTPDFLFVIEKPGDRDAFVLDATLSTDDFELGKKGTYRQRIVGHDYHRIAGVMTPKRPLRAWAMAPIKSKICRLMDPFGNTGVIPMNAYSSDFSALESWLSDLFKHITKT